jgi:D-alanyl-lipoteichoic acid acyltransferase DltB (MBOAT superfamily)
MLFNSIDFAIFLPIVFAIYWVIRNRNWQNAFIVFSSFIFYGWWDWRFLILMVGTALIDFWVGIRLQNEATATKRKRLLGLSIAANLGILGFFKYFNFFQENFIDAFRFFGNEFDSYSLRIVLPVGISFYTFQAMSYSIDVYRGKLQATRSVTDYLAFISFFPQLVAGPIERATHLLPQFQKPRTFDYTNAVNGMRQILWGLFKKMVIADNCASIANAVFANSDSLPGSNLLIGAVFFSFQIYGDFSGYSDIAIGTSRLFGFDLMRNFHFPYFSRDIAEFWRRWHISLSTWFRDYLYIPLGGSKGSQWNKVRNTFIIFIVSGFWHGANWTFLFWGFLNAVYFLPLLILEKNRENLNVVAMNSLFPSIREAGQILLTFSLCTLAWVFFRAESITHAFDYLSVLFSPSVFYKPDTNLFPGLKTTSILLIIFLLIEWSGRASDFAIEKFGLGWHRIPRYLFYFLLFVCILKLGGQKQEFIYFQF